MSRIHGLRAIIANSIENASVRSIGGGYDGITDDRLAQIIAAGKVEASSIVDGDKTIAFDGNLSFAGSFTTSGAFPITFTATEATSLVLPTTGTLATEAYVNTVAMGLDLKDSVRVASTEAVALSGSGDLIVDTITLVDGNRVLLKNQASAIENGIYTIAISGGNYVLTRSEDCDGTPAHEVSGGMYTFVEAGSQAGYGFVAIADGNIAVGTDPINFTLFSSSNAYVAGNGIDITGQSIAIHADYWDDVQAADALDLAALVATADGAGETATGGLTQAHLQLLANIVNEVGCDYADFVKLHELTVSEIDIDDVVLHSVLELVSGAAMVGYDNATSGLAATDLQAAIDELSASLGTSGSDISDRLTALNNAIGISGDMFDASLSLGSSTYLSGALSVVDALGLLDSAVDTAQGDATLALADAAAANQAASDAQVQLNDYVASNDLALADEVQARIDADDLLDGRIDALEGGAIAIVDYEEVGLGDGLTVLYTVAKSKFVAGSLKVWINGVLSKKGSGPEEVAETDPATGTFTFGTAPATDDFIIVAYR